MRSPVSLASYAAAQVRVQARVDEAARSSAPAAVAPGQPQHMASVSRAAAQAAAAQVPNDDPYRTPSASPANMRMLAGEKHGAAVNMGPPPPYKSCKPTQRTQQHNQAAVTPVGAHGLLDYPKLPAPGTAAGWQMPTSLGQPMQAAAAGACSTPSPSGARYSPGTKRWSHCVQPPLPYFRA